MGAEDHELLAKNLHLVIHQDTNVTAEFYERLFARHPRLRDLFGPNSKPVQADMLTETLIGAVDDLEGLPWLEGNMQVLGVKHREANVTPEMYDWWAKSVIETLAELSGADWNPRLERLWREQIARLCTLMRSAAGEASPARRHASSGSRRGTTECS